MEIGQKLMDQTIKNYNTLSNLELSIQISLSGLSFCILQKNINTIYNLTEIPFEKKLNPFEVLEHLKDLFNSETALQNNFSKIIIIHDNELSTLVPKPLFNEDCLADYLKFNSKILKSDFIAFDDITQNDCVNVYVPYVNINNFIYDTFGAFTFKHSATILVESLLLIEKDNNSANVYANINKTHFEIIVFNNSNLLLYSTFEYKTNIDFIYYILFTTEQLNLNPELFHLIFLGAINSDSKLYKIAYKYIRNISFGNRNENYKYQNPPKTDHANFILIKSF